MFSQFKEALLKIIEKNSRAVSSKLKNKNNSNDGKLDNSENKSNLTTGVKQNSQEAADISDNSHFEDNQNPNIDNINKDSSTDSTTDPNIPSLSPKEDRPELGSSGIKGSSLSSAVGSKNTKRKQDLITLGFLGALLVVLMGWIKYNSAPAEELDENGKKPPLKLEVASSALDSEKMWRNYFEDKLVDSKTQSNKKLELIEQSINDQAKVNQDQFKQEIEKLKQQLRFLADEQNASKIRTREIENNMQSKDQEEYQPAKRVDDARINVNSMSKNDIFDSPKSMRSFIPETSYVTGKLLGGISVSTSLGSASEPVPVIIKITDRGNLPKNFNMNPKQCQIMGSAYGDLSSERAIIRAETLSCRDPKEELVYTTKMAGIIYGDDGFNGIKGRVVQTSAKHLKNAMIGGMISGFANSGKGSEQFTVTNLGLANKKKGIADMAQDGAFAGIGNASEKLADYYIKQAESMSPVLMISGGARVDIVFTKGVYFGALDVEEKLRSARNKQKSK